MASAQPDYVLRMRVELPVSAQSGVHWPEGVRVRTYAPGDAAALHALLERGYRNGGGSVAPFGEWLPQMTSDEEYDPSLWLLAEGQDELAGAIVCWTSGFVKDLVVRESWRGRGLGEALMRHALTVFTHRGARSVELKVHSDNHGAVRLYERVGMRVVERVPAS